jgi:hypothetical protein
VTSDAVILRSDLAYPQVTGKPQDGRENTAIRAAPAKARSSVGGLGCWRCGASAKSGDDQLFYTRAGFAQLRRAATPSRVVFLVSAWILAVVIGAEHWYSSETLWVQIGVGVALLIGVLTLLVTWVPRQRLYYWAPPATPLLVPGLRETGLEIRHDGRQLVDPYLLEVTLTARGRRDIPSSAFDQGRPLVFDLGAGIVKVLQVRCSPASSLAPRSPARATL